MLFIALATTLSLVFMFTFWASREQRRLADIPVEMTETAGKLRMSRRVLSAYIVLMGILVVISGVGVLAYPSISWIGFNVSSLLLFAHIFRKLRPDYDVYWDSAGITGPNNVRLIRRPVIETVGWDEIAELEANIDSISIKTAGPAQIAIDSSYSGFQSLIRRLHTLRPELFVDAKLPKNWLVPEPV